MRKSTFVISASKADRLFSQSVLYRRTASWVWNLLIIARVAMMNSPLRQLFGSYFGSFLPHSYGYEAA
ncbi:MAG: hypothetical protein U9R69_03915, partial [Thermodesulfobacteriota bacterium]|nr:hypothetical protein [Thermodesulfobacteriota bacterium]